MPQVTLYQMPNVVTLTESQGVSVSTVMNRVDFNLFKHVKNQVEFLIKTIDRKPATVSGLPTIFIVDPRSNQLVIQQTLTVVNAPKAHFRLVLDASQVALLDSGNYSYAITLTDPEGNPTPIYMDMNHSMQGWCEVFQGHMPAPNPVTEIAGSVFEASAWGNPAVTYLLDPSSHPASAQKGNRSGQQNVVLYATGYSGAFYIQASLENTAPTGDSQWFTIPESPVVLTNFTGVRSIPFVGNFMWVRFYHLPVSGTIDKVLYKN